jgi:hypothetical protein
MTPARLVVAREQPLIPSSFVATRTWDYGSTSCDIGIIVVKRRVASHTSLQSISSPQSSLDTNLLSCGATSDETELHVPVVSAVSVGCERDSRTRLPGPIMKSRWRLR